MNRLQKALAINAIFSGTSGLILIISNTWIAKIFGIKSNINAIIFFCIGLIFFFQYKLFFMIKKQQSDLTKLVRKLALEKEEEDQLEA